MNKAEFINAIVEKTGSSKKDATTIVDAVWDVILLTVAKGESVTFTGIGSFGAKQRAARTGQNPKTGEKLNIPAATVPYFKAGNKFKEIVAKIKE